VCKKMWKNTIEPVRPRMTMWCMRAACSIHKATHIHPEYVILIALPQQQWLHESASMLRYILLHIYIGTLPVLLYMYIACTVVYVHCLYCCICTLPVLLYMYIACTVVYVRCLYCCICTLPVSFIQHKRHRIKLVEISVFSQTDE
jgi:hypothetical protein